MSMKLLLAVDGSRYTRRMLTYIVSNELLFRPHYEYVLFHVLPGEGGRFDVAANDSILDEPSHFLQTHGFSPQRMLRQGTPAAELVYAANQLQSNMVVMGCRGQSALETAVMGSVTTEVLARSHVPVLVIR
jgi:nucleotide-binding universal stress UspA family protein